MINMEVNIENGLKVFGLIGVAQGLITAGVYFIGGLLMPQLFGPLYAATTNTSRLFIALATAILLGNLIVGYAFANFSPALTAPLTIFTIVLMQIVFAIWVFNLHPSPWLLLAATAVAASCLWVSYLLNQKPA